MSHTGGTAGGEGGEGGAEGSGGGEGGDGGGEGGEGGEGGDGGASWLMVTSVFVHPEQYARHTARPCGGEDESSE